MAGFRDILSLTGVWFPAGPAPIVTAAPTHASLSLGIANPAFLTLEAANPAILTLAIADSAELTLEIG